MKKVFFLVLAFSITLTSSVFAKAEEFKDYTRELMVNGVKKEVNVVEVDLNNKDISFEVVTGNNGVIGSESFQSMINRKNPRAAINGNFFAAYDSLEPYGSIMKNGRFTYLEGKNTSLIIDSENKLDIKNFSTKIRGYLDGERKNKWNNTTNSMDFYLFDVWYVNRAPLDTTGVYIYTPDRGNSIVLKTGTAIEIIDNKILAIRKNPGEIIIPKNGYIIYYGKDAAGDGYINARFKKGRTVEFEYDIIESQESIEREEIKEGENKKLSSKNTKLFGSIDKNTKNKWNNEKNDMDFYLFTIWYINTNPIDSSGVYIYTPEKGQSLKVPGGNSVIVEDGRIKRVEFNIKDIHIPKNGYAIYFGEDAVNRKYIEDRFKIGKTVDFYHENTLKFDTKNIIKKAVEDNEAAIAKNTQEDSNIGLKPQNIKWMISAGPHLLDQGKSVLDSKGEGFKEDKINKNRAGRSALGITKDNKLILLTGGNLSMEELVEVMKLLNCEKAMNLDGGHHLPYMEMERP